MTKLQEEFLSKLKSTSALSEYSSLYHQYIAEAIRYEESKGVSKKQAKAMGHFYIDSTLSDFVKNEELVAEIIGLEEPKSAR